MSQEPPNHQCSSLEVHCIVFPFKGRAKVMATDESDVDPLERPWYLRSFTSILKDLARVEDTWIVSMHNLASPMDWKMLSHKPEYPGLTIYLNFWSTYMSFGHAGPSVSKSSMHRPRRLLRSFREIFGWGNISRMTIFLCDSSFRYECEKICNPFDDSRKSIGWSRLVMLRIIFKTPKTFLLENFQNRGFVQEETDIQSGDM